jgi:hypothetical protein
MAPVDRGRGGRPFAEPIGSRTPIGDEARPVLTGFGVDRRG